MLRPVVRKIVGMSLAPLLLAVVGDLAIFRIYFELFSVIVGTPPALTLWSATDGLLWTIKRTKKTTLAVETAAVLAHDDSSEILQDESLRNNQMASNVQILEAYLEFLLRPCQRALVDHWPRPTPAITAPFFAGADNQPLPGAYQQTADARVAPQHPPAALVGSFRRTVFCSALLGQHGTLGKETDRRH